MTGTVGAVLAAASTRLGSATASPRLDAEVLLAHVLGVSRSALLAADDTALSADAQTIFEQLAGRRARGEPVAYLTGTREFWSLELKVTPAVLIPRPETELLVEWALELIKIPPNPPFSKGGVSYSAPFSKGGRAAGAGGFSILDLGAGSGAIALAIANECPTARVTATDISLAALDLARGNATRLNIWNVQFVESDFFEALDPDLRRDGRKKFDLILSNPPYVADGDPHLADLRFEPAAALTAGPDGLSALRTIIGGAPEFLNRGAWLLVEHGAGQGEAVRRLFEDAALISIETRRDLAGHERATGGRRP